MEIAGYISACIIGITLGLIGGGGSILTVPVLVYLMAVSPITATAYSLFVVGTSSLVGSFAYMRKDLVSYKTAFIFGMPSLVAVFITRKYILPALPEELFTIGSFLVTKNLAIMLLFALLMIAASFSMIRNKKREVDNGKCEDEPQEFKIPLIITEGLVVGVLTGLIGAGGGFLIIPALVVLSKLSMKKAVGTSLLIIAIKSLIGFMGTVGTAEQMDWMMLGLFSGLAILGIFIGSFLSKYISGEKLKPAFGWFTLLMGIYIIGKELI